MLAFIGFLLVVAGIIGVQMFRGLGRNKCATGFKKTKAKRRKAVDKRMWPVVLQAFKPGVVSFVHCAC